MRKLIIVIAVVFITTLVWIFNTGDEPAQITTSNTQPPKVLINEAQIKTAQDDRETTLESNRAIAIQLRELNQQINNLKQELEQLKKAKPTNTTPTQIKNYPALPSRQKPKAQATATDLVNKTQVAVSQALGLAGVPIGGATNSDDIVAGQQQLRFVWSFGENSATQIVSDNSTLGIATNSLLDQLPQKAKPKYTIPANTFLKAKLKTSLIGRIPVAGQVEDPYRFVVDVSDRALFASFHSHKELVGMRMSGLAQGDLLLKCAKASIDSITFIFADETIAQHNGIDLAIITDEYGKPCIDGELITNAPETIGISAGIAALSNIADALAQSEQSITQSPEGNTQQTTTGNTAKFAINKGISGGLDSINQWIGDRAKSSFDVIRVDSGKEVILLTQAEIPIDYKPDGRKLRHDIKNYANNLDKQLD